MASQKTKARAIEKKVATEIVDRVLSTARKPQLLREAMDAKVQLQRSGVKRGMGAFGGVSTMSAAPVNIGNTVRSTKQQVLPVQGGVRVVGRDFIMAVGGQSSTWKEWALQGGMAMSPIALNASGLRGYFQVYQWYRFNRATVHFITSSPTSTAGDILMVYHANHGGPKVDHSSPNFLSYALSTESALIGPQWTNHSVEIISKPGRKLCTDVLNSEDVEHQADGELLVYCRATTNGTLSDSPGYLLIDYDITFYDQMLNPRVSVIPNGVFKWTPVGMVFSGTITQWDEVQFALNGTNTYSGDTSVPPVGNATGTIYQIVVDLQHAVFGGTLTSSSPNTMWSVVSGYTGIGATQSFVPITYPFSTGATFYAVMRSDLITIDLYPSYDAVFAGNGLRWNAASAGASMTTAAVVCAVGSITGRYLQASIG